MKKILGLCLLVGLTVGCSKSTDNADAAATEAPAAESNPQISADLEAVSKNVSAANYDAAVGSLLTLKEIPKSPEDQIEYQKQVIQTMDTLRAKAQTDPRARESYQMLGRAMTGR